MSSDRERRNERAIRDYENKKSSPPDEVQTDECPTCEGSGKIYKGEPDEDDCEDCEGFGEIPRGGRDVDDARGDELYERMRDAKFE